MLSIVIALKELKKVFAGKKADLHILWIHATSLLCRNIHYINIYYIISLVQAFARGTSCSRAFAIEIGHSQRSFSSLAIWIMSGCNDPIIELIGGALVLFPIHCHSPIALLCYQHEHVLKLVPQATFSFHCLCTQQLLNVLLELTRIGSASEAFNREPLSVDQELHVKKVSTGWYACKTELPEWGSLAWWWNIRIILVGYRLRTFSKFHLISPPAVCSWRYVNNGCASLPMTLIWTGQIPLNKDEKEIVWPIEHRCVPWRTSGRWPWTWWSISL